MSKFELQQKLEQVSPKCKLLKPRREFSVLCVICQKYLTFMKLNSSTEHTDTIEAKQTETYCATVLSALK